MDFLIAADTDIGLTKQTNQDSLAVRIADTPIGKVAFAILCDGMGGLAKGEVASAAVINAFDEWVNRELPALCDNPYIDDGTIKEQWTKIVVDSNKKIKQYGAGCGIKLGTTAVILLVTQYRYYIMNIGDSRAYILDGNIRQITNDQTFVAREVAAGNMTWEEAAVDPRRSVLLQCIGASDEVYPDMFFGDVQTGMIFMLCCDGFRHEITADEIFACFYPPNIDNEETMLHFERYLIDLNKQRQERDNITVALIKTV